MVSLIRFEFESITKNLLVFPFFTSLGTSVALKEPSLACFCVHNLCECQTRRKKMQFPSLFLMHPNVNIKRNIYFMRRTYASLTLIPPQRTEIFGIVE